MMIFQFSTRKTEKWVHFKKFTRPIQYGALFFYFLFLVENSKSSHMQSFIKVLWLVLLLLNCLKEARPSTKPMPKGSSNYMKIFKPLLVPINLQLYSRSCDILYKLHSTQFNYHYKLARGRFSKLLSSCFFL